MGSTTSRGEGGVRPERTSTTPRGSASGEGGRAPNATVAAWLAGEAPQRAAAAAAAAALAEPTPRVPDAATIAAAAAALRAAVGPVIDIFAPGKRNHQRRGRLRMADTRANHDSIGEVVFGGASASPSAPSRSPLPRRGTPLAGGGVVEEDEVPLVAAGWSPAHVQMRGLRRCQSSEGQGAHCRSNLVPENFGALPETYDLPPPAVRLREDDRPVPASEAPLPPSATAPRAGVTSELLNATYRGRHVVPSCGEGVPVAGDTAMETPLIPRRKRKFRNLHHARSLDIFCQDGLQQVKPHTSYVEMFLDCAGHPMWEQPPTHEFDAHLGLRLGPPPPAQLAAPLGTSGHPPRAAVLAEWGASPRDSQATGQRGSATPVAGDSKGKKLPEGLGLGPNQVSTVDSIVFHKDAPAVALAAPEGAAKEGARRVRSSTKTFAAGGPERAVVFNRNPSASRVSPRAELFPDLGTHISEDGFGGEVDDGMSVRASSESLPSRAVMVPVADQDSSLPLSGISVPGTVRRSSAQPRRAVSCSSLSGASRSARSNPNFGSSTMGDLIFGAMG